ncbi:MAG: tRNA lysidine(34) synthetase TilS [Lachnospiraceae bacterium]|nr:tRNA lysidine(34) synthetase TilS [Lachnospiraceae bacterium]
MNDLSKTGYRDDSEGAAFAAPFIHAKEADYLFTRKIRDVIVSHDMVKKDTVILAGVSGGADSRCLFEVLYALREVLGFSLCVVHVDHGIRETSGRDADAVKNLCKSRGIPVLIRRIDDIKSQMPGMSLEEAARSIRYRIFAEALDHFGADRLALAHNMDDQAETVLFKLFRGAGLQGMAGIRPVTFMEELKLNIIRPLLFTSRAEIERFLVQKGIDDICEDETNGTDEYARNRIRHNILPYAAEQINSRSSAHLAAAAERAGEALDFIEEETARRFDWLCRTERIISSDGMREKVSVSLPVKELMEEPLFMRKLILRKMMKASGVSGATEAHTEAALGFIGSTEGTVSLDMPDGMHIIRRYDRLYAERTVFVEGAQEIRSADTESNVTDTADVSGVTRAGKGKMDTAYEIRNRKNVRDHEDSIIVPIQDLTDHDIQLNGTGTVRIRIFDAGAGSKEIPVDPYTKWFDCDKIGRSVCFRKRMPGDRIDVGDLKKRLSREMIDLKIPADKRDRIWIMAAEDMVLWIPGYRRCQGLFVDDETRRVLEVRLKRE